MAVSEITLLGPYKDVQTNQFVAVKGNVLAAVTKVNSSKANITIRDNTKVNSVKAKIAGVKVNSVKGWISGGDTYIGTKDGSGVSSMGATNFVSSPFTARLDFTAKRILVYLTGTSTTGTFECAIYTDGADSKPETLIVGSTTYTHDGIDGWHYVDIADTALTYGTKYWLTVWASTSTNLQVKKHTGAYNTYSSSGTYPTWVTANHVSSYALTEISIYADNIETTLKVNSVKANILKTGVTNANSSKGNINRGVVIISKGSYVGSTYSVTVPSGLSNSVFIAVVGVHQGTISAVSWNSNSLTLVDSQYTAYNETAQIWALVSPTAGTGNLTFSYSGGSGPLMGWYILSNAKQEQPAQHNKSSSEDGYATVTLATTTNRNLLIDAEYSEPVPTMDVLGQTNSYTIQGGNSYENEGSSYYQQANQGSFTMAYDLSYGGRWAMVICAVESLPDTNTKVNSVKANLVGADYQFTIGYTSTGGFIDDPGGDGKTGACKHTAIYTFTPNYFLVNFSESFGVAGTCYVAIYSDNAGAVGNKICSASASYSSLHDGWLTIPITGSDIVDGTTYWLVANWWKNSGTYNIDIDSSTKSGYDILTWTEGVQGTWTDAPTTSTLTANRVLSMYVSSNIPGVKVNSVKANIQSGGAVTKVNTAKANIVTTTTKINSSKSNISRTGSNVVNSKANIKSTYTKINSVKGDIKTTYTDVNFVKADIKQTYTKVVSVKADIKQTYTDINSVKANVKGTVTYVSSVKANIKTIYTNVNSVKADIKTTYTKINSSVGNVSVGGAKVNNTKGNIKSTYTQINSSKASLKQTVSYVGSVKANLKTTYTQVNTVKANLKQTYTQINLSKADIKNTYTKINSVKADIRQTYSDVNTVRASIKTTYTKINSVKANVVSGTTTTKDNYSKSDIKSTYTKVVYSKANIPGTGTIANNTVKANVVRTVWVGLYPNGYKYRKKITIDYANIQGGADLTNFDYLYNSTDTDFKTTTNSGKVEHASGYDIRFESTTGVKLDHEIERFTGSSGELIAWVRIPTVSYTVNTELYVYFGKTGMTSTEANPTGVWNSDFKGVWHLSEDPSGGAPQMLDSTSGDSDLTTAGSMTSGQSVDVRVGKGLDFDGAGDYASHADAVGDPLRLNGNQAMTMTAYIQPDTLTQDEQFILNKYTYASSTGYALVARGSANSGKITAKFNGSSRVVTTTTSYLSAGYPYRVDVTLSGGTTVKFYVNGSWVETQTITSVTLTQSTSPLAIGCASDSLGTTIYDFDGKLDECRIVNIALSDGWIATERANANNPSSFYSVGALESSVIAVKGNIPGIKAHVVKANIVTPYSKVNFVKGNIYTTAAFVINAVKADIKVSNNTKVVYSKADILVNNNTKANNIKANILTSYSRASFVKADIKQSYSKFVYAKANIKVSGNTVINSVKADIKQSYTKLNSIKANVKTPYTKINSVKANLWRPYTSVTSVKGNLVTPYSKIQSSKADILQAYSVINTVKGCLVIGNDKVIFVKANILFRNTTIVNSVKASIVVTNTKVNAIKADILVSTSKDVFVKADIKTVYSMLYWVKANILAAQTKINSTKANILRAYEQISLVKADIKATTTQENSVKAYLFWQGINYTSASLANILAIYTRGNYAHAYILQKGYQPTFAKGNILVRNNTVDVYAKASIVVAHTAVQTTKANILAPIEKTSFAKADIKTSYTQDQLVRADILRIGNINTNTVKASIVRTNTNIQSVKADILAVSFKDNSVKADIKNSYTAINMVMADIKQTVNKANSSKGDILRGYTQINSVKGQISITRTYASWSKALIRVPTFKHNVSIGNILVTGTTKHNYAMAFIPGTRIQSVWVKANIPMLSDIIYTLKKDEYPTKVNKPITDKAPSMFTKKTNIYFPYD